MGTKIHNLELPCNRLIWKVWIVSLTLCLKCIKFDQKVQKLNLTLYCLGVADCGSHSVCVQQYSYQFLLAVPPRLTDCPKLRNIQNHSFQTQKIRNVYPIHKKRFIINADSNQSSKNPEISNYILIHIKEWISSINIAKPLPLFSIFVEKKLIHPLRGHIPMGY